MSTLASKCPKIANAGFLERSIILPGSPHQEYFKENTELVGLYVTEWPPINKTSWLNAMVVSFVLVSKRPRPHSFAHTINATSKSYETKWQDEEIPCRIPLRTSYCRFRRSVTWVWPKRPTKSLANFAMVQIPTRWFPNVDTRWDIGVKLGSKIGLHGFVQLANEMTRLSVIAPWCSCTVR